MADAAAAAAAARRLSPVIRLAPAKLNLTLSVRGRRRDGFHQLHSVMVPLALADRLSVARAEGLADTLSVAGYDAGPAVDNLVLRAIVATRAAVGRTVAAVPLAVRLEKRIPVAAGLAGGSSDAAAAIDAALEAWGLTAPGPEARPDGAGLDQEIIALRRRVAASLGSDVPFFLAAGPALVEGRGEQVTPLRGVRGPDPGVLLLTPAIAAPTPAVFAAFDAGGPAAPADPGSTARSSEHLAAELGAGLDGTGLVARAGVLAIANDLAPAAGVVVPGLVALRRALVRRLGRPVGVSGSGPTLWVLYPSESEAATAAEDVRAGLADGAFEVPGSEPPSIVATRLAGRRPAAASDAPVDGTADDAGEGEA